MLQRKNSIKIEICSDRRIIHLKGVSTENALEIIKASNAIKVSHIDSIEEKCNTSGFKNLKE